MATNKFRTYAITGAVAAITATGAWYGAGLNMRQELKQQRQEVVQHTAADRLAQLEASRNKLVKQREEIQKKIELLEAGQSPSPAPASDKILPER